VRDGGVRCEGPHELDRTLLVQFIVREVQLQSSPPGLM
jgi:hypothetical protein